MAEVLGKLGTERAWVVHGSDGLDELTTTGPSFVAELHDGKVTSFEVTPEDAGLPRATAADLKGGDPATNAVALNAVLDGQHTAPIATSSCSTRRRAVVAGKAATCEAACSMAGRRDRLRPARARCSQKLVATHQRARPRRERRPDHDLRRQARAYRAPQGASGRWRALSRRAVSPTPPRGFAEPPRPRSAPGPLRADRRDQEGVAEPRPDPRRFRSGRPGARLREPAAPPACRC